MKKKFTKIASCLLCLAMLLSMAAPAVAAAAEARLYDDLIFAPEMEIIDDEIQLDAPGEDDLGASAVDSLPGMGVEATPFAETGEYEIYPTPQSVTYGSGTVTLPATMQVTYGAGIDQYTKDRAVEAFKEAKVTLSESASTSVKLSVTIGDTGNDDKYDAYKLTINASGVTVVGKDTDAAFYGLTTVKRILQQIEGSQVKYLTLEDYADVAFRGFIEGYYGNPWTVEDRAALMAFGGELKQNIYFYAPKDDPKHSEKWRELYTKAELDALIRPLAEAGNKSKCYYGFALHPFWADGINYADETQYQADLGVLKDKFEQVMSVGVRQIAVLADDRGLPTVNGSYTEAENTRASYIKLMKDLTDWVKSDEMQTKYPGLKTSIPFCPNDYMNDASSVQIQTLVAELPDSVPIIQTGGRIWGQVSHSYLNSYRTNTHGGGTFMWVNWPCSDKSKGSLTMGAHDIVLHDDLTDEDIATLKGIMLNPMQQSEPSKQAIFTNADYSWNIWNGADAQERKANAWDDSFKYVDHDSAIETPTSTALREMGKHMIHQNGSVGWHEDYPESKELSPKLSAFRTKLDAGTLTGADIAAMREEFVTLHDAAVLYKNKTTGNLRILGQRKPGGGYVDAQEQMAPWLDYWEEFSQSNLDLLDALSLMQNNADGSKDSDIVEQYLSGQGNLTAARAHSFLYMDHDETAIAGGMYIVPFTNQLLSIVSEEAKAILDPSTLIETIITNRPDTPDGGLAAMRDGDLATEAIFKRESKIDVGDYVGVRYNLPITVTSVRFEVGRNGNADDSFNGAKLQYMDESGQWVDIPGGAFASRVATMEVTGLNLETKGVRAIATAAVTGKWFGIKEIYINGQSGATNAGAEIASGQLTGTVIKTDSWSVASGSQASSLTDGNDSTSVEYDPDGSPNSRTPADTSFVGDFIGLDLGEVVPNVGRVRLVIGNGSSDNKWTNFKLQYSTDNTNWTDVKTYTSTNQKDVIDEDLGGVAARYIRFVNTVQITKWLHFAELSVWADASATILYQSDVVKKLSNPEGTLTDDSASLSANNVSLRPGEFVGIALPRIRKIVELIADFTPAPGLVLKVGMSEADLRPVETYVGSSTSGAARLFAANDAVTEFTGLARYIRLENDGSQNVSFRLTELSVKSDEIEELHFAEEMTHMGISASYGFQDNRETTHFFDGDMSTSTTLAHEQTAGEYATYDLGQLRPIRKLTMAMQESEKNYLRHGVVEVSPDGKTWTTVITVDNDGAFDSEVKDGAAADPAFRLGVPSQNCVSFVGELGEAVQARYLRIRVTEDGVAGDTGNINFIAAAEILINTESLNEMEYVRASNDPTFETDPIEPSADYTPDKMLDGDLTTGFRPNMKGKTSGYLIYRLSDKTSIGQINVVQDTASPSNATVQICTADGWQTLSGVTLNKGLNQIMIPEDVDNVLEVKFSWGDVTPTFYEIITVPRELVAKSGGQAASDAETIAINSYAGDDRVFNFDENWKFNLGDASGAEAEVYNDASWRTLNLPHDYSIEGEYTTAGDAESAYLIGGVGWYRKAFTIDSSWANKVVTINFGGVYMDCEVYLNGTKLGEHHYGYSPFAFVLPNDILKYTGENVIAVKTDDAFPSSRWYSGAGIYRSVHLTVTSPVHVAKYGTKVETTNAGAVTVKTTVENSGSSAANVTVEQAIYELDSATYEKKGSAVASTTGAAASPAAGATADVTQTLNVTSPKLWNSWDKGEPNLYVLVTTVKQGSTVLDTYETEFGFREIDWDVDRGFKLNGEYLKLKGVCQHHDQGGLGSEAWYRALERQVDILMDMGCNSIRVTHNPAADELIDICNRKGVLLIDEMFDGWAHAKNGNNNDFSRWFNQTLGANGNLVGGSSTMKWQQLVTETIVNRDKNAPSVIMYSLCNEVQEGGDIDGNYPTYANELIGWIQAIDNTRYVTRGDNTRTASKTGNQGLINQAIHDAGGVVGFNYYGGSQNPIAGGHNMGWRMYASETVSHVNTRGVYDRDNSNSDGGKGDGLLTAYDKSCVSWGAVASDGWWRTIQYDYSAGEYIWTGFDYMGEPTPYNGIGTGKSQYWSGSFELAAKSSYFGAIDTNGLPKDNYWLYRSMWNVKSHTLHILPTWDKDDLMIKNGKVEVVVYTDAPMVKLYLNNTEVGTATATTHTTDAGHVYRTFDAGSGAFVSKSGHQSLYATFNVTYAEGTLRAVACDANGQPLNWVTQGRSEVKTTSGASKLVAEADRDTIKNDGRDLSYITISVTDKNGNIVNGAKNDITVSVAGDGVFMALDNGVQPDHTSFLSKTRQAGAGQLVAIVQSTKTAGEFTLTATAPGLSPASVTVKTAGAVSSTSGNAPVSYDLSKTFYVQLNTAPDLPTETTVTLANGSTVTRDITWDAYDKSLLSTAGTEFTITGIIADYGIAVSVGVVVLDNIVALLNYSAAVRVGQEPTLPDSRPAVMADGTVVSAQFHVDWTKPDSAVYNKAGTVVIKGTATVFEKPYDVTATIRVSKGEIVEGNDVSNVVQRPKVNGAANNDLLKAFDGDASTAWTGSGATMVEFDTAQNLYRIVLTYATTVPTGTNAPTITLGGGPVNVKPKISGTTATYELGDINSSVSVTLDFPSQVSLANVQLITASSVFPVGSTAEFDRLKVNGLDVAEDQLAAKAIKTSAENAVITPISNDNVAVTILPENSNSQIIVVTESEDHAERAVYTIQLDAPKDVEATDSSHDYPYAQTTATAGSDQGGTEGVGSAVDGSESTIWHSAYNGTSPEGQATDKLVGFPEKRWFQLELQQPTELVALRYKPRPTQTNGTVKDYKIEVSQDGKTWTTVATGTWGSSAEWKIAMFDRTVTAKYVKLWGINTYGDGKQANQFMTAAEVRVVTPAENEDDKIDLSAATITILKDGAPFSESFHWKNLDLRPGDPNNSNVDDDITVTVSLYGKVLQPGVDYRLDYDNNVDPGTAYIYARALDNSAKYQGAAATTFQIAKTEDKITSFQPVILRVYPGVAPELPTEVLATKEDQHRANVPVTWGDVSEEWYNYPTDDTGELTLEGTIEDEDMLAENALLPTLTLKLIAFQSADTVSLVTSLGVAPALPETVTVRFADGTSAERPVTWNTAGQTWTTAETVEIKGDILGVSRDGAKASVRVAESSGTEYVSTDTNIALNTNSGSAVFPFALAFWSSGNNNPYQAITGQTSGSTAATNRWSDWERDTHHTGDNKAWMGVAFETSTTGVTAKQDQVLTLVPHMVNKVGVMFVDESGNTSGDVTFPDSYTIQYYTGPVTDLTFDTRQSSESLQTGNGRVRAWGTTHPLNTASNWSNVTVKGDYPAVPSSNGQMLVIEFEPVETAIIRVLCTPKSNKWSGIQALEVYEAEARPAPPAANSNFTATLALDGGERLAFSQDTVGGKTVNVASRQLGANDAIPTLEVTTTGNPSIAISQASRVPGAPQVGGAWAQAVITSEDGSKTETYIVKFTREGATSGYAIDTKITSNADKVTISPEGGLAGTEITVSVAKGYQLTDLWVQIADGDREGELIKITDGKFLMPADNVTFSAGVSPITYKLVYTLNGGTMTQNNRQTYTVETNSFTLNNPTRPGYTFVGWVGSNLTSPTQTAVVSKGSIGDRTYIAVWSENNSIGGGGGNNNGGTSSGGSNASSGVVSPGGNVVVTETNPVTGATTVTTATSSGLVTAVTTDKDGQQTAVIQVPENSGSFVDAVMPALDVDGGKTPVVKIQNNTGRPLSVTVPFNGSDTVVAVRQEKDGTETVIPMSVVDEDGLRLKTQPGDQTIYLVDNKKTFADVPDDHWAAKAVNFTASRELFNGLGDGTFAPTMPMNRAMMTTVLWRLAEKPDASLDALFDDVQPDSYYEEAVAWGVATGVVKGTDVGFEPDTAITRETLATLLYRAAGSPTVVDEMPRRFTDGAQVADWAQAAMVWCIQNDIIKGYPDNTLGAKGVATRAEVATMLQRFVDRQV